MKLRMKVIANAPRLKADKTATITLATMLELTKEQFDELNDAYYNKEELFLFLASEDEVVDLITEVGKSLAE